MDGPTNDATRTPENLSVPIYNELRRALISGRLMPGDSVSIRTLALGHNVSTMPVREALKLLSIEKALIGEAKKAYRVPDMHPRQAANLFQIRAVLEGEAAGNAIGKLSKADFSRLRAMTKRMNDAWAANDACRFLDINFDFHSLIYMRAGNADLSDLIESLFVRTGPWLAHSIINLSAPEDWNNEHFAIVDSLEAGDAARARLLVEDDAKWSMTLLRQQ